MVVLIIIGGISLGTAAFGSYKGCRAGGKLKSAHRYRRLAESIVAEARQAATAALQRLERDGASLGRLKVQIWEEEMGRFARVLEPFVEVGPQAAAKGGVLTAEDLHGLRELPSARSNVLQLFGGSAAGLGTGAAVSFGVYGAAGLIGTASTGTAISTLSGAAATNAAMAWLGGGALSAGGAGIAGGTLALGAIAAGPALAVIGAVADNWSAKRLAAAREQVATARVLAADLEAAQITASGMAALTRRCRYYLARMRTLLRRKLDEIEPIVNAGAARNHTYTDAQLENVRSLIQLGDLTRQLSELPLADTDGPSAAAAAFFDDFRLPG